MEEAIEIIKKKIEFLNTAFDNLSEDQKKNFIASNKIGFAVSETILDLEDVLEQIENLKTKET